MNELSDGEPLNRDFYDFLIFNLQQFPTRKERMETQNLNHSEPFLYRFSDFYWIEGNMKK